MKIIFAGTPEFAAKSLAALVENNFDIIAVYTQPDRPAGRGKKLMPSEVKAVALEHDIPVYQPLNFKSDEALDELKALDADLMIVAAYGIILPKAVLEAPKLGCINIHASLLPRWRGAAPIQRAIQHNDDETGITIMQMDEGLDTGDMLLKLSTEISPEDTGGSLHDRLAELGAEAILSYLRSKPEVITATKQDDSLANYAHKLSKQEALLDFNKNAAALAREVRAFNPWPVSYLEQDGKRIRVFEAEVEQGKPAAPGTVLEKSAHGVLIACNEQALRITRLQLPGGKQISAQDFFNGGQALLAEGVQLSHV